MDQPNAHPWIWLVYLALFALAVPWYLPAITAERYLLGLPLWVTVSLGASVLIALFTVYVIQSFWADDE